MHGRVATYFRDAGADARTLRSHGLDAWPDAEELARYVFDLEDGMSALARELGVEMTKDVRGRWQTHRAKGGRYGRPKP